MKWYKTVRHQAILSIDGETFNVLCEDDNGIALSINGEYVTDVDTIPTYDELIEFISEYAQIERMAEDRSFAINGRVF